MIEWRLMKKQDKGAHTPIFENINVGLVFYGCKLWIIGKPERESVNRDFWNIMLQEDVESW